MLHTLVLENFKQHRYLEIDFESGLNVINGDNGAGKSTILKAVMYCLFGSAATASKKENLSTWGSVGKMECRLSATVGGKSIILSRGLDKSTVYKGEELLASGHTPCTKWVEQELGLDAKTFKQLLYAAQGETQALLRLGAADLQRKIEQITKTDVIDKILKLIGDDLQVLSGKLSVVPEVLNLSELEKGLEDLRTLVTEKINFIDKKEQMTKHSQGQLEAQRLKLRNISQALAAAREVRAMCSGLETTKRRLDSEIKAAEAVRPSTTSTSLLANLEAAKKVAADLKDQIAKFDENERKFKQLQSSLDKAKIAHQGFVALIPKYERRARLWADLTGFGDDLSAAQHKYRELSQHQVDCPTCNRPFDSEAKTKHLEKLESAKHQVEIKSSLYDAALAELNAFDKEQGVELKGDYQAERNRLGELVMQAEVELKGINIPDEDTAALLLAKYANAESEITLFTQQYQAVLGWESNHANLLKQMQGVDKDLAALASDECDFTDEDLLMLEDDIKELQDKLQADLSEISKEKEALSANKLRQETQEAQVKSARESVQLRNTLEKEQAGIKGLQAYLRANRARLMGVTWSTISDLTGAYTSEITGGLLSGLTRGDDGEFFITEGEHTVPVSELSGGRQSIVGLALRIALGQTFYGDNGFILLDEIGADLSETNAAAVGGFLGGLGTQVISVSHRQGDSVNAVNVIVL